MHPSFDAIFYQAQYPTVYADYTATGGSTGLTWAQYAENHYDTFGFQLGYDPTPYFDTSYYLATYFDVAAAGVNPFDHFVSSGAAEGRFPNENTALQLGSGFDNATYLAANSDVAASTFDAYEHWVLFGGLEGRSGAQNNDGDPLTFLESDAPAPCFAAGTLIATPSQQVAVEALSIGDMVLTHSGRAVPVLWIGRRCISLQFSPADDLCLVRIRAGALGYGLPRRDLRVTADHALLVDGLLINAGALVNHGSVAFVPRHDLEDRYMVYHIETPTHDIILAEGQPVETFIDYAGRHLFHNYGEYLRLYGAGRIIPETPAPRISTPRLVPAQIRARLDAVQTGGLRPAC